MTFAFTRDLALVREVLTHPTQARMSSDDGTDLITWDPSADERVYYVLVSDPERGKESLTKRGVLRPAGFSEAALGIFSLYPQNAVCYEIHAALLPRAWGARSRAALRGALEFAWRETPARRIVCAIPAYNALAIKLAKDCGFRAFGRNRASWLRWGKLHDQILLGISR